MKDELLEPLPIVAKGKCDNIPTPKLLLIKNDVSEYADSRRLAHSDTRNFAHLHQVLTQKEAKQTSKLNQDNHTCYTDPKRDR